MERKKIIGVPCDDPLVSKIRKHFVIRWKFTDENKEQLIGPGMYHKLVGKKRAERHFNKALYGKKEKYLFKVNKTLEITFTSK